MSYPPPGPGPQIPPPPGGLPPARPRPPADGQPPGPAPAGGRTPQGGYPARDPYEQPPQAGRRRGGCRGCIVGCLLAALALIALVGVLIVGAVFMVRQMFPSNLSFGEAAGCAVMRVIVNNADLVIDQADATPAEKADMRRAVQEVRAEYERQCLPQRLL